MSHRFLWSCATLTAVIVVASLTAVPAAQTQTAGAAAVTGTATPPRTPWGDPDLQGIWTGSTLTPLERPSDLAGKQFLTEEEAAALEQLVGVRWKCTPARSSPQSGPTNPAPLRFSSRVQISGTKRGKSGH